MPFASAETVQAIANGNSINDTAIDTILEALAFSNRPVQCYSTLNIKANTPPTRPDLERIVCPVHLADLGHWTLIIVEIKIECSIYVDSLPHEGIPAVAATYHQRVMEWLRIQKVLPMRGGWSLNDRPSVLQETNVDCGLFMLVNVIYMLTHDCLPSKIDAKLWRTIFVVFLTSGISFSQFAPCHSHGPALENITLHDPQQSIQQIRAAASEFAIYAPS